MSVQDSITYGAYHISNNRVEYTPQKKCNFLLVVNDVDDLPRVGADLLNTLTSADIIADGQQQLILGIRTCDVPYFTQNTINISRGNSTIKFAGKPTFNEISIDFYDYIGSNIKDTLLAWQNLSYNTKFDYAGLARSYKKDCQLLQLTPTADIVRYWDIKGAWLSSVQPQNFDMTSDGEQTINATMQYDWAEMHLPDDITL